LATVNNAFDPGQTPTSVCFSGNTLPSLAGDAGRLPAMAVIGLAAGTLFPVLLFRGLTRQVQRHTSSNEANINDLLIVLNYLCRAFVSRFFPDGPAPSSVAFPHSRMPSAFTAVRGFKLGYERPMKTRQRDIRTYGRAILANYFGIYGQNFLST
jgi:hypothetical protein